LNKTDPVSNLTASQLITNQIAELDDWRGKLLSRLRQLILEAAPDINEEWKWETGVWSQKGNVISTAAFNNHIKLIFSTVLPWKILRDSSMQDWRQRPHVPSISERVI